MAVFQAKDLKIGSFDWRFYIDNAVPLMDAYNYFQR